MKQRSFFDRFADSASSFVSHAPFFAFCVLLVVIWAPTYFMIGSLDTWQLIINTVTTIITFLLVALLQNSDQRFENTMNTKIDALSKALSQLLEATEDEALVAAASELRQAIGVEDQIGA